MIFQIDCYKMSVSRGLELLSKRALRINLRIKTFPSYLDQIDLQNVDCA